MAFMTEATELLLSWRHLAIFLVLCEFPKQAYTEGTNNVSLTSVPWTMSNSSITEHLAPSSKGAETPSSAGGSTRLDFISIAVICGVVALCIIICVIIGCRRKKRRHHLPRCQDVGPTVLTPSTTGMLLPHASYVLMFVHYNYSVLSDPNYLNWTEVVWQRGSEQNLQVSIVFANTGMEAPR